MALRLHKKIKLSCNIRVVTGLSIGSSKETVDIGGVDLPVIRRKDNGQPYLPGSSIKGKMRCLLEQAYGVNLDSKFNGIPEGEAGSAISYLFGSKSDSGISRIQVRDAYLTKESQEQLDKMVSNDLPYTEVKFENTISRVKGTAEHPRQIERVPAGAEFELNFVINVFAPINATPEEVTSKEQEHITTFRNGMSLLLDDYLGGHGSRGYGQIELIGNKIKRHDKIYRLGENQLKIEIKGDQVLEFNNPQ